jgi:hypothetical protein
LYLVLTLFLMFRAVTLFLSTFRGIRGATL